jgi:hypothetical protein
VDPAALLPRGPERELIPSFVSQHLGLVSQRLDFRRALQKRLRRIPPINRAVESD